jgi:hypothetical protein
MKRFLAMLCAVLFTIGVVGCAPEEKPPVLEPPAETTPQNPSVETDPSPQPEISAEPEGDAPADPAP